ncbi:MAG: esterase-like activity of phytase family protein [Hyphomicrobiales bacterium]
MTLRRWAVTAAAVLAVAFASHAVLAQKQPAPSPLASPIDLTVEPWMFSPLGAIASDRLTLSGAIRIASDDPRFGGFSGLVVSADGQKLLAVSDDGWWLKGTLQYKDGRLSGFSSAMMAPLKGADGKRATSKRMRDAEAMVALSPKGPDGPVAVGFERLPRVEVFNPGRDGFPDRPRAVKMPRDVEAGPENDELEAIGLLKSGRYIAISEGNMRDDSSVYGWVFGGADRPFDFGVKLDGSYRVTDLAVLPSGDVLLLERSFAAPTWIPGMAIRLVKADAIKAKATLDPETLFEGEVPRYLVDNMEGLAVWQTPEGETRLLVMSDDNFARDRQSTLLVEFVLKPASN